MTQPRLTRLLGEFLIIMFGVLAALAVDEWRTDREHRAAERMYVGRLIADLVVDSSTSARAEQSGANVAPRIDSVLAGLADEAAIRARPSLAWPPLAFTYARQPLRTTTFDELVSSGRLDLIRDDAVRFAIGDHYHVVVHSFDRLDERRTRLAWALADVFPSVRWGSGMPYDASGEIDPVFWTTPNAEARMQRILGPEYQGLLAQERVYAMSMEVISGGILDRTLALLEVLRAYQAELD